MTERLGGLRGGEEVGEGAGDVGGAGPVSGMPSMDSETTAT